MAGTARLRFPGIPMLSRPRSTPISMRGYPIPPKGSTTPELPEGRTENQLVSVTPSGPYHPWDDQGGGVHQCPQCPPCVCPDPCPAPTCPVCEAPVVAPCPDPVPCPTCGTPIVEAVPEAETEEEKKGFNWWLVAAGVAAAAVLMKK